MISKKHRRLPASPSAQKMSFPPPGLLALARAHALFPCLQKGAWALWRRHYPLIPWRSRWWGGAMHAALPSCRETLGGVGAGRFEGCLSGLHLKELWPPTKHLRNFGFLLPGHFSLIPLLFVDPCGHLNGPKSATLLLKSPLPSPPDVLLKCKFHEHSALCLFADGPSNSPVHIRCSVNIR